MARSESGNKPSEYLKENKAQDSKLFSCATRQAAMCVCKWNSSVCVQIETRCVCTNGNSYKLLSLGEWWQGLTVLSVDGGETGQTREVGSFTEAGLVGEMKSCKGTCWFQVYGMGRNNVLD